MKILSALVFALLSLVVTGTTTALEFDAVEFAVIKRLGPWPPSLPTDSSNRASENLDAIRLGEALFFDHALGGDSKLSCSSCHDPGLAFTDGRKTGHGRETLARNTSSLLNLKANRWFGWGGENDSLWAQSIRPLLAANEMAATPDSVKAVVVGTQRFAEPYRKVFGGDAREHAPELVLVNVGKALAAYQETLFSERSPFDDFRDALLAGDRAAMAGYPESAQRGLKLFIGRGRCSLCHFGASFSNGEFGDIGIPYFTDNGVDAGRYGGIQQLKVNPYNRLGEFNDGDAVQNAIATRQVRLLHRNWGEFKIPGLRAIATTAPYMHDGSIPTLRGVVEHYSNLDEERLHSDGEKILRPLKLSEAEIDDLVSFLKSLGEY